MYVNILYIKYSYRKETYNSMTTTSEITIQTADQHPGSNPLSGWGLGTDHLTFEGNCIYNDSYMYM